MKFDVFVSFRGIDTRRAFVSHLLLTLFKNWITTFKHEEEILEKQPPSPQVLQAIEESRIAIVVISNNYAASCWCLDELTKIIECKEKGTLEVVPVFYEVDPSDVLRQVDDLEDHGKGDDDNLQKVKRWKDALKKLIYIYCEKYSYWEKKDSYSYIIDEVLIYVCRCLLISNTLIDEESLVQAWPQMDSSSGMSMDAFASPIRFPLSLQCLSGIVTKGTELVATALRTIAGRFMSGEESSGVKPRPLGNFLDMRNDDFVIGNNLSRLVLSNDFNSFVGMDRLMKEVYKLLDLESKDSILELGICGKTGVGKTTLARCLYEQISPQFQDHHYFINETTNCSQGTCLLEDIARASLTEESESLEEVVKAKLGHRKVLLIVDVLDMNECRHLINIKKSFRWFGPGSRLIFVSVYEWLLVGFNVERRYVVESLRYDEALQLFSLFAFKQEQVPREYYQLSVRAVTIAGCIPLALKVFGTFLCGKYIHEWERELCRLEASQSTRDCIGKVSGYIRDALS